MKGIGFYNTQSPIIKRETDLINENVTRVLLTVPGERVGNPTFGSRFKTFLFDLDVVMKEEVVSDINSSISRWEPRITINKIDLTNLDPNTITVKLEATIKSTLQNYSLEQVIRY